MKIAKNKGFKIVVSALLFMIILVGGFFTLLFWNGSYKLQNTKVSSQLIDKIRVAQQNGSVVSIDSQELNEIIGMYFKSEKTLGNIIIKGIYGDIVNNNLKVYIPVSYKGLNVLTTSEGELLYKDNKIMYKPLNFKAGKITLPKNFVLSKLKGRLKEAVIVENDVISVDKNIIPIQIKSIEVKDNKILIGIEKLTDTLKEKLNIIENKVKQLIPNGGTTKSSEENLDSSVKTTSPQQDKNSSNSSGNVKDTSEMDVALNRISGGLSEAIGSVSTGGQKAVISEMISVIDSIKGNPSANPYEYAGSVRAAYNKLSPQEKSELKVAVFSNVNGGDVNIVSKMLSN